MNPIISVLGSIDLMMRKFGDKVKTERYRKKFIHCGDNVRISAGCKLIPEHIWIGNNVLLVDNTSIL